MNRPIKFMVLDDEGNWRYWGFVEGEDGRFTVPCSLYINRSYQFTSLHDKDGKEIYEGHIMDATPECGGTHKVEWLRMEHGIGFGIDCSGCMGLSATKIIGHIAEEEENEEAKD